MIGAILGDIIGSPYEFKPNRSKDFPLFTRDSRFTDDTVMTLAVAQGLMDAGAKADNETVQREIVRSMQELGSRYPQAGYGGRFRRWLYNPDPKPYGSYGNGSAMRVSSVAWLFDNMYSVLHAARLSAEVTHNHPDGVWGAQATAAAIFLARTGKSKDEIRDYIESKFEYDLHRTCDEIRDGYDFDVTCKGSVPEAIIAFLDSTDFEDAIRNAVSLGGDSDTQAAIAGAIAEGFYPVPEALREEVQRRLPADLYEILQRLRREIGDRYPPAHLRDERA